MEVVAKTMEYSPAMSVTGVVQNPGGDSIKLELHSLPLVTVSLHCSATLPDDVEAGLLTVIHTSLATTYQLLVTSLQELRIFMWRAHSANDIFLSGIVIIGHPFLSRPHTKVPTTAGPR